MMSASLLDWTSASAEGLLTEEECYMLLDVDLLNTNEDLLKSFPSAAPPKFVDAGFVSVDETSATLYPPSPPETKPPRSQLDHDLLQQLENDCKQENIFSSWLEDKVELPIYSSPQPVAVPVVPYVPPVATEELLREFDTVYGAVELTHLTPPHSPPGPASALLATYAQHHVAPAPLWSQSELEELTRPAASPSTYSPSPSSPCSSSPATSDDETSPRRYTRVGEDRRSRKKEQNKNAATRYRQKKKAEVEVLLAEESALRSRHVDLGNKCSDLQREIRYLKGLMRDLYKAKGLIK